MPMGLRVLTALVAAGAVVMTITIGGLWWFTNDIYPGWLDRGIGLLFAPLLLAYLFAVCFVWYKIFMFAMGLLGALDD